MRTVLFKLEQIVSGILLAVLSGTIFIQVLFRFFFNLPLAWSEEISRYSFIWLTMVAAPICIRLKSNISMDALNRYVSRRGSIGLEIASGVIVLILTIVLLVWGVLILDVVRNQSSPAIGIPMYWVYAAIPTGAFLMLVECLATLNSAVRRLISVEEVAK